MPLSDRQTSVLITTNYQEDEAITIYFLDYSQSAKVQRIVLTESRDHYGNQLTQIELARSRLVQKLLYKPFPHPGILLEGTNTQNKSQFK
jgi:hypothetical protein